MKNALLTGTLRILDGSNGQEIGRIDRGATEAEYAAVLRSLGADYFDWDPCFYDAGVKDSAGNLVAVLSPQDAT